MFSMPGSFALPTTCHQVGKKVFGLYQSDPLIMLTITQAITASQFTELKSISASCGRDEPERPIHTMNNPNICSQIRSLKWKLQIYLSVVKK